MKILLKVTCLETKTENKTTTKRRKKLAIFKGSVAFADNGVMTCDCQMNLELSF